MKIISVCLLAALLCGAGSAAPKSQAQINRERAEARQRQQRENAHYQEMRRKREAELARDRRDTARAHRDDTTLGHDVHRNAEEARDNLHDVGRQIRDWFDF